MTQKERLEKLGAENLFSVKNRYCLDWYGTLKCVKCGRPRNVGARQTSRKKFNGICLSCTAKVNVGGMNRPDSPRISGKKHHLYRRGFTINGNGYRIVSLTKTHPFRASARKSGQILEHRLVMATHLKRNLSPWEVVHHKNGNKLDNRICNLELLSSHTHLQITQLQRENERLRNALQNREKR